MARSRRSRNQSVTIALLPGMVLALVLWSPGHGAAAAAGAAVGRRPPPARWVWRGGPERGRWRSEARAAGGDKATSRPEEEVEEEEDEEAAAETEELGRLKANAAAAWLVNITLVVWIVYLYQRTPSETSSEQIISLLSQELADESTALTSDRKLKEDLKQAEALASNAKSLKAVGDSEESVLARLRALLASRDEELQRRLEATERDLRQAAQRPEVQRQRLLDDSVLGPLTSSASGVLAGLDVTIAAQSISLALLFSVATSRLRQPPGPEGAEAAAAANAPAARETAEERERRLRGKQVLRFYGRWDDDREWVLLESVALQGAGNTVIGSVRSARGWMGSWSDRIITSLVARSARGLVRRRGWKRIVEQTMAEVGRTFSLGYLVETAADKASPRIKVESEDKRVLEVPSNIVLDP